MNRPQVHWYYKRVRVADARENVYFELPSGLAYLFRRFHLMQPDHLNVPPNTGFPGVGIELQDGTGSTRWQRQSIPAQLYSSPRKDGIITKTESAPVPDLIGFGINMSANFKPKVHTVNLYYDVGETIYIIITGQTWIFPPGQWGPDYIDIAVEGVFIP